MICTDIVDDIAVPGYVTATDPSQMTSSGHWYCVRHKIHLHNADEFDRHCVSGYHPTAWLEPDGGRS